MAIHIDGHDHIPPAGVFDKVHVLHFTVVIPTVAGNDGRRGSFDGGVAGTKSNALINLPEAVSQRRSLTVTVPPLVCT